MSTFMPNAAQIERKWYVLDAAGKPLGRVAAQAAVLLRGKHKPAYTPHVDCGDHVIIINCADAVLTGNKLMNKHYYRHTGYIGHLKDVRYDALMKQKPTQSHGAGCQGYDPEKHPGQQSPDPSAPVCRRGTRPMPHTKARSLG